MFALHMAQPSWVPGTKYGPHTLSVITEHRGSSKPWILPSVAKINHTEGQSERDWEREAKT